MLKTLLFVICCSFINFLFSFFLSAQRLNTKQYTIRDGLTQNETEYLFIDHQRQLWITTFNSGVVRFNGQEMKAYTKKQGLSNNYVTDIGQDKYHYVWIATQNGLNRFDGQHFKYYLTNDSLYAEIEAIAIDSNSRVWFFQKGKGLGYIENEQIFFVHKSLGSLESSIQVFSMLADSKQGIWISTLYQGIFLYNPSKKTYQQFLYEDLPFNKIYTFKKFKNEGLIVGTDKGIFIFSDGNFKLSQYIFANRQPVYALLEDSDESIWASTFLGVYHFNKRNNRLNFYNENNGLSNKIYDIIEDIEGGIWFSSSEGIFRLNNRVFETYTTEYGLLSNHVSKIGLVKDSSIWLCSELGLSYIDKDNKINNIIRDELNDFPGPLATHHDRFEVYVFGNDGGLYLKDNTFNFRKISLYKGPRPHWAILNDQGELFLGGGFGVSKFDGLEYSVILSDEDLDYSEVNALALDRWGNLWIATEGSGLFRYKDDQIKNIDFESHLPNKVVTAILADTEGNIWFGTNGNGIFKIHNYEVNEPIFQVIGFEEYELSGDNILGLCEDAQHSIWITTNLGISKITSLEKDLIIVENYKEEEGLKERQIYPNAIIKGIHNSLWVGTTGGLVHINSSKKIYPNSSPKIYISDIKLFFENIDWKKNGNIINTWTNLPDKKISLHYKDNHLDFKFVAVSFNVPEKIRYQWKLEGFQEQWTPLSKRREAIYPNLPYGNYVFKVRACNGGNICSDTASFSFRIKPPPHRTPYATAIIILVIGLLIYIFIKRQIKNLKISQNDLEQKVKERTTEIESKKAEIEYQAQKLSKALKEIDLQNQELINANNEIKKSIDFASKIQKAFFVSESELKQTFAHSFILSMPRNLIASDFLWLHGDSKYMYLALADCSGIRVSGGFLALIGNMCLDNTVKDNFGLDPASLLSIINDNMLNILDEKDVEINTAMDLVLCRIDFKARELIFSGARRPLIYIKNNELKLVRGSFFSTGMNYNDMKATFENTKVRLDGDVSIYLFSDGFPNQTGGSNKSKYKISNFKKLLHNIHHENMNEQSIQLRQEFYSWLSGNIQTDDILVSGINLTKELK